MRRRPPRSTLSSSSAASDVYKRQPWWRPTWRSRWRRRGSRWCSRSRGRTPLPRRRARSPRGSGLLERDRLDQVRHPLERVSRRLERVHHVLELHQLDRVETVVEHLGDQAAVGPVGLVLQAVDLHPVLVEVLHHPEARHGLCGQLGAPAEHVHLLDHQGRQLVQLVEDDQVTGRLHEVHAVVQPAGQAVDVVPVEGGDERLVEVAHDGVRGLVGVVLGLTQQGGDGLASRLRRCQKGAEQVRGSDLLSTLLASPKAGRKAIATLLREAEHDADEATHTIMRNLNQTFVTPFDRDDIYTLASRLDDCMDFMEEAGDLVVLYELDELPPLVIKQVDVLRRCAELTAEAMPRLRAMKNLTEYWVEINRLENVVETIALKES